MLTINWLLVVGAFIALIFHVSTNGRPPLWVVVLLLALTHLLGIVPLR